jgi:hypothetical protein
MYMLVDAMKKHFADLCASYGRILVICLAEKSGNEARLVAEFERQLELLKQTFHPHPTATKDEPVPAEEEKDWVKFLGWDFHQKCKGMHYEKVLDLVQQIDSDISNFGFVYVLSCFGIQAYNYNRASCRRFVFHEN